MEWPISQIKAWQEEMKLCKYGVAIIDIDYLIRFCLRFNHEEINDIVKNIFKYIQNTISQKGKVWKSDGDEFLIMCPDLSKTEMADLITKLKKGFKKEKFAANCNKDYSNITITYSAGNSSYPEDGDDIELLIRKAVVALFNAKALRRDRVIMAPDAKAKGHKRILIRPDLMVNVVLGKYGETGKLKLEGTSDETRLWEPQALDIDNKRNVYIVDQNNHAILKYDGIKTRCIAGTGEYGYSGDGGLGTKATLNKPTGITVYKESLYITDTGNDVVRRLDLISGNIETIAGNGKPGYGGDGGKAVNALLNKPGGAVVDHIGNLYINDIANNVIRKVDLDGIITTFAGNGKYGYAGDGSNAIGAEFAEIYGLGVDKRNGNIYIADYFNHCIRKIYYKTGIIETVAGTGISGYEGDGGNPKAALLDRPVAVHIDDEGNMYIAESGNSCVRFVDSLENKIYTLAGDGVPGFNETGSIESFRFSNPNGLSVGENGVLYILDGANSCVCSIDLKRRLNDE